MRRYAPHLIAWMTILVATWFGVTFLTVRPAIGWVLIGFAALRLGLWIHHIVRARRR